jgi:hypothetical protein
MDYMHNYHHVKRQSERWMKKTYLPKKSLTHTRNQNHTSRHKQNHRYIQHDSRVQLRITACRSSYLMGKMNRHQQHSQQITNNVQIQRFSYMMRIFPLHDVVNRSSKSNVQRANPAKPMHRRMAYAEHANLEKRYPKNTQKNQRNNYYDNRYYRGC